ncbi:hypothetical protein Tco_1074869 [Tanacetum coccineum]
MSSGPSMSSAYLSRSSSIITSENEPQAALATEFQGMANQSYTGDSQLHVFYDNDQVNNQVPSFSSAFPRGGNSATSGFLSSDNRSVVHEAAPGVDGFGRGNASRPSINGNNGENHANAPTFTANGREGYFFGLIGHFEGFKGGEGEESGVGVGERAVSAVLSGTGNACYVGVVGGGAQALRAGGFWTFGVGVLRVSRGDFGRKRRDDRHCYRSMWEASSRARNDQRGWKIDCDFREE